MDQVMEWLPETAFTQEATAQILHEPLSLWSSRWFLKARAEIRSVRISHTNTQPAQGIHVRGASGEVRLSGRGKRAILESALNIDLSAMPLTEGDHKVLDSFVTEIVSDLLATVETFGAGGSAEPTLSVTIALGAVDMAVVDLSVHAFVPCLKKAVGPVRKPSAKLRSRMEALKRTKVRAEGYLGHAELSLGDLKNLAVGDVVVLDESLKDPIELRLAGNDKFVRRGKMVRSTESVSIHF